MDIFHSQIWLFSFTNCTTEVTQFCSLASSYCSDGEPPSFVLSSLLFKLIWNRGLSVYCISTLLPPWALCIKDRTSSWLRLAAGTGDPLCNPMAGFLTDYLDCCVLVFWCTVLICSLSRDVDVRAPYLCTFDWWLNFVVAAVSMVWAPANPGWLSWRPLKAWTSRYVGAPVPPKLESGFKASTELLRWARLGKMSLFLAEPKHGDLFRIT